MNSPLTIGYMAATADIEQRNRTQRDRQQQAALASGRRTSGTTQHTIARFGEWLRGNGTTALVANRAEAKYPAPVC